MRRAFMICVAVGFASPIVVDAAPREMATAAPARAERPGKPTGPIVVEHRLQSQPSVGVPLTIAVTARVEGDVARLGIEATATAPRAVVVSQPLPVASGEGVYSWEITVVPLAADAGYLSVIVSGSIDGTAQARSVTIALRGAASAGPAALTVVDGETLIALPVQESP